MKKTLRIGALLLAILMALGCPVLAEDAPEPVQAAEVVEAPAEEPAAAGPEAEEAPAEEESAAEEAPMEETPMEEAPAPEETPDEVEPEAAPAEPAEPEEVPVEETEAENAPEELIEEEALAYPAGLTVEDGVVKKYTGSADSLVIPDGITEIGESAFSTCQNLVSVTLPSSLKIIGRDAFIRCRNLKSINIPSGVTSIGIYAFSMCSSLESIAIPGGVTEIGNSMFEDCTSLKSVSLPSSLTSIGMKAFRCCESLESISIPSGVDRIEYEAFAKCGSLKSVKLPASADLSAGSAFSGCASLTTVTMPKHIAKIGSYTFSNCTSLKSITLPEGLTTIQSWAFYNCASLYALTIPKSVTLIQTNSFAQSKSLTLFVYPGTYGESYAQENTQYHPYALVGTKPAVTSASANASTVNAKESVAFTVETPAWAKFLALYTENGTKVKTWGMSGSSSVSETNRAWRVEYAISSPGDRELTFRCSYDGEYGEGKTVKIKVKPLLLAVESASASVSSVPAKQEVTFTVQTPAAANYLAMFSESGAKVKVWGKTGNSAVSGSARIWTVAYAIGTAGNRQLTFKCASGGEYGEGKTVSLKVTAVPPAVASVSASPTTVNARQEVTFTVKTPSTAKYLAMYAESGSKVKVWGMTGNSTVSGSVRTWTVTYAIAGKGNRTLTFKCAQSSTYGEGKTVNVTVK